MMLDITAYWKRTPGSAPVAGVDVEATDKPITWIGGEEPIEDPARFAFMLREAADVLDPPEEAQS